MRFFWAFVLVVCWQPLGHAQFRQVVERVVLPAPEFTREQASTGRKAYRESCAGCHGAKLEGLDIAPALAGNRFDYAWRDKSTHIISFHIRRMPPEGTVGAGTLSEKTYTEILAYILASNGFTAGEEALPTDMASLGGFDIPKLEGGDFDPVVPVEKSEAQTAMLASLPVVTDAMLQYPSANDWLHWGRTYDGQSYSPLKDINKGNVKNLKLAWRAPLLFGSSMPMPLVHQGVMYLHTFPDTILAIDGTNGDVLWRYAREGNFRSSKKMGLALHGDRVYASTSDLHMIALNAKTGELVWDREIEIYSGDAYRRAIFTRSAPLIAGKVVIQGTMGFRVPKGAFIVAYDRETGEEAWRFNTVAWPDAPGGNTWNDLPVEKRNGGSVWQQGTYDPESNLIYFGVAPTYDTAPLLVDKNVPGHNTDAMYTNCTVAIDADTGKLIWYFQHTQNDQWDLDWAFERTLADIEIDGEMRRVVMNVGKNVMLDALDAATGEFLFSVDSGAQNIITAVDPDTGYKTIDPSKMPSPERPAVICPVAFGARSWPQTSYSPDTQFVYVPITESCFTFSETNKGGWLLTTGVAFSESEQPGFEDGMMGRLQAIDVASGELAWNTDLTTPASTGVLSTAGGLVFTGDVDPSLKAFDDATGEILWEAKLDDAPSSSLVTYKVGDVQYIGVIVGMTNNHVRDITSFYRTLSGTKGVPGDAGGASIWVFALK